MLVLPYSYSHYYSLHTLQDGGVSDCVAIIVQVNHAIAIMNIVNFIFAV